MAEMNDVSQGEDGVCFICLDTSPSPIQSGCACRGAAGLAHLGCRVEAAEALVEQKKDSNEWWWTCQTCEQKFTGEMRDGLANAWWSRVCDGAEDDRERLAAATNLASSLSGQGKYDEAENMQREVLAVKQRVLGAEHPDTLAAAGNLAVSLEGQEKYDEAEKMQREVLESHPISLSPCVDHGITGHIDTQHTHTHKCNHRGYVSQAARATWYPRGVMIL